MTPEKLKEIEARCEAASEGPWELSKDQYGRASVKDACGWTLADMATLSPNGPRFRAAQDAALIAHARTDVPALIARVKELEGLNERLKQEAQSHAYEAKAQRATVHECNQAVTQGTGEPADWHGANPVKDELSRLLAENKKLRVALGGIAKLTELIEDREDGDPILRTLRNTGCVARAALGGGDD